VTHIPNNYTFGERGGKKEKRKESRRTSLPERRLSDSGDPREYSHDKKKGVDDKCPDPT